MLAHCRQVAHHLGSCSFEAYPAHVRLLFFFKKPGDASEKNALSGLWFRVCRGFRAHDGASPQTAMGPESA